MAGTDWKRLFTERNEGTVDRAVRVALGLALLFAFTQNYVQGALNWAVLLAAIISLATGLLGHCTLYGLLGIKTTGKK